MIPRVTLRNQDQLDLLSGPTTDTVLLFTVSSAVNILGTKYKLKLIGLDLG